MQQGLCLLAGLKGMCVQERPSPGQGWLLAPGAALQVLSLGLKGPSSEAPLHLQGKDKAGWAVSLWDGAPCPQQSADLFTKGEGLSLREVGHG